MRINALTCGIVLGALTLGSFGGCTISTTPEGHVQTEWAGTHARQQAKQENQDRAIALRVRKALAHDAVLAPLDLSVFVDYGHVRLCGDYPDQASRDRAVGLSATLEGVISVSTRCGGE